MFGCRRARMEFAGFGDGQAGDREKLAHAKGKKPLSISEQHRRRKSISRKMASVPVPTKEHQKC